MNLVSSGTPMISVIIPVRDGEDTLSACLAGLEAQTLPLIFFEVIVVDDGSRDRSAQIAEQAGVTLLQQAPRGPAAARNLGAQSARGEILVFTDADCQPAPDFLERIVTAFQDEDVAGAKGSYRTGQRGLVPRFMQQEYQHKYDRMAQETSVDFIDTYAAAYRREIFLTNRGFDVHFPTACVEDQELSFRLARKGYKLVFMPQASVFHRHDRSLGEYCRRKFGIGDHPAES